MTKNMFTSLSYQNGIVAYPRKLGETHYVATFGCYLSRCRHLIKQRIDPRPRPQLFRIPTRLLCRSWSPSRQLPTRCRRKSPLAIPKAKRPWPTPHTFIGKTADWAARLPQRNKAAERDTLACECPWCGTVDPYAYSIVTQLTDTFNWPWPTPHISPISGLYHFLTPKCTLSYPKNFRRCRVHLGVKKG